MNTKSRAARFVKTLAAGLALLEPGGGMMSSLAQEPTRAVIPTERDFHQEQANRRRRFEEERAIRMFTLQSGEKMRAARGKWREGRHEDAAKLLEQCLGQARETFPERPIAPSVEFLETLARIHESEGAFAAAVADMSRALEVQAILTGPQSWESVELGSEIGRLNRLEKLGKDRLETLSRIGPTLALVSAGTGAVASAVCIDPRGLFLTRARPLANLWRSSATHFEYDEKTHALIGLRTEHNTDEPLRLLLVLNPGRPDQAVLPALTVRTSMTEDLALLAAPTTRPLAAIEMARGHEPKVGAEVTALNHWNAPTRSFLDQAEPIFLRACPSSIAAVRYSRDRPWILQLDAAPPAGGSEGPVVDGLGRLLGFAIRGLPGTGVSYTIPIGVIEGFLGKAVLMAEPPVISYRERKREHEWSIPIWVAASEAPEEVAVDVAFGEGPSLRSFRSTSVAGRPGVFPVRVVPLDPAAKDRVDLLVGRRRGIARHSVEDGEVSVGPTRLRLSEIRRLELGREPRGFAADGRPLAGAIGGFDGLRATAEGDAAPVDLGDASSLDVVYPPESVDPIPGEMIVRARGEVLHRERFALRIGEAPVELGGVLDVSRTAASGDAGDAPSPTRLGEDQVVALEGEIGSAVVGGAGRYLLLTLRKSKGLIVFDLYTRRIAARVPVADDDVLVAAGSDAFFLVYPSLRIIHRWDLRRMALDRTTAVPIRGDIKAVALGSASTGPLLVRWSERQAGGGFSRMNFSLIDPGSLKVLEISKFLERSDASQPDRAGEMPRPGVLRLEQFTSGEEKVNLRASPRGDVFGLWRDDVSPQGFGILSLRGSSARALHLHMSGGHLIPGQDGRTVFTGTVGRLDLEGRPREGGDTPKTPPEAAASSIQPPTASDRLIPAAEAAYYLAVKGLSIRPEAEPDGEPKAVVAFQAPGLTRPLGELEIPWQAPGPVPTPTPGADPPRRPDDDQRFHWLPSADMLVVIPPTDDRLILRRVGLDEMLERLEGDALFVSSPRAMDVVVGRPFRHAMAARPGRGRAEFRLLSGPIGLRLTPDGELVWEAPAGTPGDEVEAAFEVKSASGRAIRETVLLRFLTTGRAAR